MNPRDAKFAIAFITAAIVSLPVIANFAVAQSYPVTGKWSYEDNGGDGPAQDCGSRYMDFQGERRFDTGGYVRDYRNHSSTSDGDEYKLQDDFFNGAIRGRMNYNIRRVDNDRIELRTQQGNTVRLRRCQ